MTKRQYLIVSDNLDISQSILKRFAHDQVSELRHATSLPQAFSYVIKNVYCLLIIDLQIPGMDRTEMVQLFNIAKPYPILGLTETLSDGEKITLYRAGVDVFLEKPINPDICSAQANALAELYLKPDTQTKTDEVVDYSPAIIITPRYRRVFINGQQLALTRKEFDLLHFLAKHSNQVFSLEQIYERVWDGSYKLGGAETVKSHIKRLRRKLSEQGMNVIENEWGVGYRFVPPI